MDALARLFQHPASTLVAIVVVGLVIRVGARLYRRKRRPGEPAFPVGVWAGYALCFFSGVLLTNGLVHFSHGISAEPFAAPFGYALRNGFPRHLSNVLWGFLNLVLAYVLFARGKMSERSVWGKITFFAGMLVMGIVLSFIFSHRHAELEGPCLRARGNGATSRTISP